MNGSRLLNDILVSILITSQFLKLTFEVGQSHRSGFASWIIYASICVNSEWSYTFTAIN